jgi:hypothetical protein
MTRSPSPGSFGSRLGRFGFAAGFLLAGVALTLAGAALAPGKGRALAPDAAQYVGTDKFLVIVEDDAANYTDKATVTKLVFQPLKKDALPVEDAFEVVSVRLLQKGLAAKKQGKRLGVVLKKKAGAAKAAGAGIDPVDYELAAGEIVLTIDPDGPTGGSFAQETEPIDVEPMPDPCGSGRDPLLPPAGQVPAQGAPAP